ncbi:MAG: hypothetical protein P8P30_03465 [Rickettsiales bacterium]|nr:hypothetical protein [Rickettsiales bacterium]
MAYSLKSLLMLSVAACVGLSACNKLGYGEIRTAPVGQAMLGAKRMPQMNGAELQKQRSMQGQNQQQAMQQRPPMMQMQPQPMMQVPQQPMMQMQPQPMMQMQPPTQQMAPQIPADYPVTPTPYSASPQSYQPQPAPQQPEAQSYMQGQQPAAMQQSAYDMPYAYAPGSYHNTGSTGLARTVSATDYYAQDSAQPHSQAAVMGAGGQQWYAPAAPVGDVYGGQLPVSAPGTYSAGYGMDAVYGRYQAQPVPVMPQEPSFYQPMTANHAANHPARDPYAVETMEPQYNNFYYGGEGMPQGQVQGQNPKFSPNFDAAGQGAAFTNGFGQRAGGMISPVSSQYYGETANAPIRRALEEPPMLSRESMLPNPNAASGVYYGDGGYQ